MPADTTEASVPAKDGIYGWIPEEQYHLDRGSLPVSGAKLLLPPSCPAKFRHEQDNPRKPKKVWDFGHVAHRLILGKGAEIAVLDPAVCGLNKDGKESKAPTNTEMWKEAAAKARSRGQVPIHIDDYRKAEVMAEKVLTHPVCGPWFVSGEAEQSGYATDESSGVRLRGRADWITENLIVDVKTSITANPAELKRAFWKFGYFMQDAWYRDLFHAATGAALDFRFVVVEKEPPHLVTVIEYDQEAIAEGRRLNRQAIDLYNACHTAGDWPGYTDGIVPLSLPYWALRDRDRAIYNEANDLERNWDDFFSTGDN
jgi:hypothetical protein